MPLTLVLTWRDSNPGEGCSDPVIVMVSFSILIENRITEKKKSSLEAVAVNRVRDYGLYKTAGGMKGAVFWSGLLDRECERRRSQGWRQGFGDHCSMDQARTLLGMQQLKWNQCIKKIPTPHADHSTKVNIRNPPLLPSVDGWKKENVVQTHVCTIQPQGNESCLQLHRWTWTAMCWVW